MSVPFANVPGIWHFLLSGDDLMSLWRPVRLYGNEFWLYIRDGRICLVRTSSGDETAKEFERSFPSLFQSFYRELDIPIPKTQSTVGYKR